MVTLGRGRALICEAQETAQILLPYTPMERSLNVRGKGK